MEIINLNIVQWLGVIISAFLIGFSKTGISGLSMPVIAIIAGVFGGKEAAGIMLPMLIIGDAFALYFYKRHAEWKSIKRLLPWVFVGLSLGVIDS